MPSPRWAHPAHACFQNREILFPSFWRDLTPTVVAKMFGNKFAHRLLSRVPRTPLAEYLGTVVRPLDSIASLQSSVPIFLARPNVVNMRPCWGQALQEQAFGQHETLDR